MKKSKISIITPVYNAEKYIARCIESVQKQTYKNIEHIIIDDGSTDNTYNICQKYKDKIKLIHKANEGVSKARNIGIENSRGDYLLFVDADDWLEENMCQKMIEAIINFESDIVICAYNDFYENKKVSKPRKLHLNNNENFLELLTDETTNFGGFPWNKLIKRDIVKNYFNEEVHYYENLLFFLENCNENTKFTIVNEYLYNYCINDNSAVHSKKYSLKKLTALDSLNKIIPLLPKKTVDKHKLHYINSYYNNLFLLQTKMKTKKHLIKKYKLNLEHYYKDVIKSSDISFKNKVKTFCMHNIYIVYYLFKKIKER